MMIQLSRDRRDGRHAMRRHSDLKARVDEGNGTDGTQVSQNFENFVHICLRW